MIEKRSFLIGVIVLAVLGGALFYWKRSRVGIPAQPGQGEQTGESADFWERGTVTYVELEGGFYGIVTEDGRKLDPTNLSEGFREDGLKVRFKAEKKESVAGIHMWGTIVEIVEIEKVE